MSSSHFVKYKELLSHIDQTDRETLLKNLHKIEFKKKKKTTHGLAHTLHI